MTSLRPALTRSACAAAGVVLLGSLAACGGGSDSSAAGTGGTDAQSVPSGAASGAADGTRGGFPGASGLVADISGKTLQVQGQSGQTAVTYTASTTITAQVAAKLASVTAGSCVMVTPVQDSGASTSADEQQTAITAASVRITAAQDGSCEGGFGGGTRPSGAPSGRPTDMPSGAPSGAPGGSGGGRGGFGAFGEVLAVSANGFSVMSGAPGGDTSSSGTTVDVTVTADTTYTTTRTATAAALAVGKCVSASGQTDATGAVTAERISVSDAVDGQCSGGLGGRGGFGGGQAGAAS